MAQSTRSGGAQRKGTAKAKPPVRGMRFKRDVASGKFLIGRDAFSRISAVEGIHVSKGLEADLRKLDGSSYEKRRSVLARKYGKRK
jgi:hypothetical protein